jgi:hypothetical protein
MHERMTPRAIRLILIGAVLVGLVFALCPMVIVWPWQMDRRIRIPVAKTHARSLAYSVYQYHADNGVWPPHAADDNRELIRFLASPDGRGLKYFDTTLHGIGPDSSFEDPWGRPYHLTIITSPASRVTAWSDGPNQIDEHGKADDIVVMVPEQEGIPCN